MNKSSKKARLFCSVLSQNKGCRHIFRMLPICLGREQSTFFAPVTSCRSSLFPS